MLRHQLNGLLGKKSFIEEIRLFNNRRIGLRNDIEQQRGILGDLESRLEGAREEWIRARKERRILERMKEKAFDDYVRKLNKAEAKQLDEISLRPFSGYSPPLRGSDAEWEY